jgi:hypothetical protein
MGNHYVPQKYLKGFAESRNPDIIWMYDKKLHQFANPSIKQIAQESAFYSAEVERQLNEFVERPANLVLDKLRDQVRINDLERIHLAIYIATMLYRVPRRRTRAFSMLPSVLEKTINEVTAEVQEWARVAEDRDLVKCRLAEIERAKQSLRNKTPDVIIEQIRTPWASKQMISLVSAMSWEIVHSGGPNYFLTSDNPVYFFEAFGMGKPKSELTFPIATDLALFASWQGAQNSINYLEASQRLVREANRRLASDAERFVFYHRQEEWIAKISDNPKPYISRIQW